MVSLPIGVTWAGRRCSRALRHLPAPNPAPFVTSSPRATPPQPGSGGSAVSMALRRRSGGVGKRRPGPEAVEAALKEAAELFPKRSAELPPLVLRHQLYGLAGDRTAVDRHLVGDWRGGR